MPKQSRKWQVCKRCGRSRPVCGPISTRGNCYPCAEAAVSEALRELSERRGSAFYRYRMGLLRYVLSLTGDSQPHGGVPVSTP